LVLPPLRTADAFPPSRGHTPTLPTRTVGSHQFQGSAYANGPYTVQGNTILDVSGKPYLFHGIGRDSLEYSCSGDGHLDAQELAYMGSGANRYAITYWGANTVRLPLSEGIWLYGQSSQFCGAAQYQALVKQTVDSLTALHLNVILDLQWIDAGGQSGQAGGPWAAPDADSVTFWQQVASIYQSYSNVLFELYNEPHPATWSCWLSGCTLTDTNYSQDCGCNKTLTYASVGMQALVNAVRGAGATNLAIVAGMDWGFNLSLVASYPIQGINVIYDTHPYPYSEKMPSTWDAAFGKISATYPVISAESGEYDCGISFMSQLLAYFDDHHISWVAWAWVVQGSQCGYPLLIQDYRGTPVPGMGQLIYLHLRSYL
ncbi:MAG TPA: cellulase family glycosylhydrolase, partial [Ktedonobacteraceae bacterium]|nr:cellulase family glycosylhydrolase [Ktedonobacteraceae bacterium]